MDEFLYHSSLESIDNEFLFENKQYTIMPDQNNGNYPSAQIKFDLVGLANSAKFVSWDKSYLAIPLVMNLEVTGMAVAASTIENAFAASLKNGYHQLINSIQVDIANNTVTNLTNFSNLDINYRLLTTSSKEDEENRLPSMNFYKDSAESIRYNPGAAQGLGECNNAIKDTLFSPAGGWGTTVNIANKGRKQRCMQTSFDPVGGTQKIYHNSQTVNSAQTGKNHVVFTPPVDGIVATTSIQYNIIATIRLAELHDIFRKLPLVKGAYIVLTVNTNAQCKSVMGIGTAGTLFTTVSTTSQNGIFPCMISPLAAGNGFVGTTATAATLSLGIGKSYNGAFNHPTMTQCRLYACTYTMSPVAEDRYFSMMPVKKVLYNDILSFQSLNVGAGATVNSILTNGVSRLRYLLMIPQLSASINGSTTLGAISSAADVIGSPMNSPFSSSPATCCPHSVVGNFNVILSGSNLYQNSFQYGFEEWLNDVRPSNSLNGGVPLGMSSGILSPADWENGYRYVYVDLSRRDSTADDDKQRSVQVQFTNLSPCVMDYYYVVAFERELSISTSTGALVA